MVAHGAKVIAFKASRPCDLRIVIVGSSEVSNAQDGARQKIRVFHYDKAPNSGNNKVDTLIEVVTGFLSLGEPDGFIFFLFAIIVEELPRYFI
jgi:hypothetical protein